jgi:hypothetical protein
MSRILFGLVSVAVLTGVMAGTSLADPNLQNVPMHRHWLGDPSDGVQIGPKICDDPTNANLQKAFNQFHHNVHHSVIPGPGGGPVDTLGPQDGAPGLNNDKGGELTPTPGCGLPPTP